MNQEINKKSNIQQLTAYINSQEDPQKFMQALFLFCKPCTDDFSNGQKEMKVGIG